MINIGPRNKVGPAGPTGPNGLDGATWLFGSGEPGSGLGKVGDFFLNGSLFEVFRKYETGWELVGTLKGPKGKKGDAGEKGEKGDRGPAGYNGMRGPSGGNGGDLTKGLIKTIFGELTVDPGATVALVSFVVPAGKAFELMKVLISGNNIADFYVKEDGAKIATSGTDWLEYDDTIPFERKRFDPGQTVSVEVKNLGVSKETFNATIVGDLFGVL